jgi:hypothetical protein
VGAFLPIRLGGSYLNCAAEFHRRNACGELDDLLGRRGIEFHIGTDGVVHEGAGVRHRLVALHANRDGVLWKAERKPGFHIRRAGQGGIFGSDGRVFALVEVLGIEVLRLIDE